MADFDTLLSQLANGITLTSDQAESAFEQIMSGGVDPIQIAAFLMALRVRGETVDEIAGGARVLRDRALSLCAGAMAVDTCGTGGDGIGTYNISSAAAVVSAAAGCVVAKHGNRSVSSKSGSADVLTALGANLDIEVTDHEESLSKFGFTFMFAPAHHHAMKNVAPIRAALKLRTIFNLLGPLSNPAKTKRQLLGVYDKRWVRPMAEVLKTLGSEHVWVVHGQDGLDELTVTGSTFVAELKDNKITEFEVAPADAGLPVSPLEKLKGGDATENAAAISNLLDGKASSYRDIVVLNSAAALIVGGLVGTLSEGVERATTAIDNGRAKNLLRDWIAFTNSKSVDG